MIKYLISIITAMTLMGSGKPNIATVKIVLYVCVCVLMPTHCTIKHFGIRTKRIDGVECGLFSNHAPLGQTTLRVARVSV